jgi:hypothetical protein
MKIRITYEIVTPESAAEGEAEDSGWINEEGIDCTPDDMDLSDAEDTLWDDEIEELTKEEIFLHAVVKLAEKEILEKGGVEPSSSQFHKGIWYTQIDSDKDYATGADERWSFHLDGFTEEQEKAIHEAVTAK